eukprot:12540467-Alexandrium_andersonii.AAC.1
MGRSQIQHTLAALAVLVSLQVWCQYFKRSAPASVCSDSLGALAVLQQRTTASPELDARAQEYALDDAVELYHVVQRKRMPGISNIIAEARSR